MLKTRPQDERFRAEAERIASWESARYSNPPDEIDLTDAAPNIEAIRGLGSFLHGLPVEAASAGKIEQCANALAQISNELALFGRLNDQTTQAEYNDLVARCWGAYQNFVDQRMATLLPLVLVQGTLEGRLSELNKLLLDSTTDNKEELRTLEDLSTKTHSKVEKIIREAEQTASAIAVASHENSFAERAVASRKTANKWLNGAIVLGGIAFTFAIVFAVVVGDLGDAAEALGRLGGKALLVGLLVSAAYWCGRNYRALIHQATLNEAKADALSSFQIFHKGAATDEVKDAVLLETTRSIFSIGDTGFIGGGADSSSIVNEFYNNRSGPAPN